MKPSEVKLPLWALLGLGASQIIGYGTLFYAFSILVPDIARDLGRSPAWIFGAFSVALLVGGFTAPLSGRLSDRFGAPRMMVAGSLGAALLLALTASASGAWSFAAGLAAIEAVSALVLYPSAFTAIVQLGGTRSRTTIVHLTLIAGFASTLFWPLTSWLHQSLSWREMFLLFAALNLAICLPIHVSLARLKPPEKASSPLEAIGRTEQPAKPAGTFIFVLLLLGFAVEGLALSAILVHMVPLTQALGLGAFGLGVASLFGPAQVLSRVINLVFGKGLPQAWLAVIAAGLVPLGLAILLSTTPWLTGAAVFALCLGLGSGLNSIVGGTLPLELFGAAGYGGRLGWCTLAKQVTSAIAPLAMSMSLSTYSATTSLTVLFSIGVAGVAIFLAIALARASGAGGKPISEIPA